MNVTDVIEETITQTIGGLLIGGALDGFFGVPAQAITKENALKEMAIILIQMGALGVMTAVYFGFLQRRGVTVSGLMNIPFIVAVVAMQQGLFIRLQQMKMALIALFKSTYLGAMPQTTSNPAVAGYQPVCTNQDNVDVPVPHGDDTMPPQLDGM